MSEVDACEWYNPGPNDGETLWRCKDDASGAEKGGDEDACDALRTSEDGAATSRLNARLGAI
ncbi:hypothetical protein SAMN05421688_1956 [Poseidonocella pacifica]|uniref:Uncharacterized protein n=1 Tax=Poseidonocella pacifica TaxID=871651 RepID=A0A1I0X812_9RHOB|nr:hypothetical protein SAMN05421688_1956 [Poseidonocella pacifica]